MEYYWELVLKDGTRYEIPPSAVETVRDRMGAREPVNLKSAVIPYSEIGAFRKTNKAVSTQPLLEEAAQAFRQPITTEIEMNGKLYDGVEARWVKKEVTSREWSRFYAPSGYRQLDESGGMVTVAFRLPTHLIDQRLLMYCTAQEVAQLDNLTTI
jgi:hypothetical protein